MAALLAGHPEIRGVLNLGVAGSFELGAAGLGQVACVGREIWPEFGLAGPDGVDARGIGFALHEDGEGKVWDSLELKPRQAAEELGLKLDPLWPDLSSLSVSAASGYLELAQGLRTRYAADLENMEGFALALACRRAGLPFLEVRAVSNLVGSREKKHWDLALALRELGRAAAGILA